MQRQPENEGFLAGGDYSGASWGEGRTDCEALHCLRDSAPTCRVAGSGNWPVGRPVSRRNALRSGSIDGTWVVHDQDEEEAANCDVHDSFGEVGLVACLDHAGPGECQGHTSNHACRDQEACEEIYSDVYSSSAFHASRLSVVGVSVVERVTGGSVARLGDGQSKVQRQTQDQGHLERPDYSGEEWVSG